MLLASSSTMVAQTVSESVARQTAAMVFGAVQGQTAKGEHKTAAAKPVLSHTSQQGDEVYYYAYNNPAGGFVIIGGDEQAKTVLGYCAQGHFDYDRIPANMKSWLAQYEGQIHSAKAKALNKTAVKKTAAAPARAEIEPML